MFFQVAEAPQPQHRITYENQGEDEVGRGKQGEAKKRYRKHKKGVRG